jgi:hypothetical protein
MTEEELLKLRVKELEYKLHRVRHSYGLKLYRNVFTAAIARGCNVETAENMARAARVSHGKEVELVSAESEC